MRVLNDSMNHPLRFIDEDGTTYGQFYNSWDKQYHLVAYDNPYSQFPTKYLCGGHGNFSPSRMTRPTRNMCKKCFSQIPVDLLGDVGG